MSSKFLRGVFYSLLVVSTTSLPTGLRAEGEPRPASSVPSQGGLSLQTGQTGDSANLPAPLSLRREAPQAESVSGGVLDALPSFPAVPPPAPLPKEGDILDFIMRRRANPSLVPDGPNPTEDAAVALSARYRFQAARSRALSEPAVQQALADSKKARTDRELREALRRHYSLLFARMRSLDSSLETLIQEREKAALEPLVEKGARADSAKGASASASRQPR